MPKGYASAPIGFTTPDQFVLHFSGQVPLYSWPPGIYGTDGSGGEFTKYKEIARAASELVLLASDGTINFAASFALPGQHQTVPEAELHATVVLVQRVQQGLLEIVTDSHLTFSISQTGKAFVCKCTNCDLWHDFISSLHSKPLLRFRLLWMPSHMDNPDKFRKYAHLALDPIHMKANFAADQPVESHVAKIQLAWRHCAVFMGY